MRLGPDLSNTGWIILEDDQCLPWAELDNQRHNKWERGESWDSRVAVDVWAMVRAYLSWSKQETSYFFAAKLKILFYFILFSFLVVRALSDKPLDWLFPYLQSTSSNLKTVADRFPTKPKNFATTWFKNGANDAKIRDFNSEPNLWVIFLNHLFWGLVMTLKQIITYSDCKFNKNILTSGLSAQSSFIFLQCCL